MDGLYLHIPFCTRKCIYCDFYSIENLNPMADFLEALKKEIRIASREVSASQFSTIFFGGGTPSLLSAGEIESLLVQIREQFVVDEDAEVTVESNPGTLDPRKLEGYRQAGVNRLSVGIQSFRESELLFLGRIHDASQAEQAVRGARQAGFDNVSVDLIYSLPGQTPEHWRETLLRAIDLGPDHISAYSLIVEENTPLARLVGTKQVVPQPAEREAEFFELTSVILAAHGYDQYEISNFARPGFRSRHNLNYWRHGNYLGLGPSAHSFRKNGESARRWWNIANVKNYSTMLETDRLPIAGDEVLSEDSMVVERFFLGLRSDGVRLDEFRGEFRRSLFERHGTLIDELVQQGMMTVNNDALRLTSKGYLLCDEMSARLTC
jgi:oxygen-independent coproporphyrinogen-3 oxidase